MSYVILILRDTALKGTLRASRMLRADQRVRLNKGQSFTVESVKQENNHWFIRLTEPIESLQEGYIYLSHAQLLDEEGNPLSYPVKFQDDFASHLVKYMFYKKHVVEFTHGAKNIVYLVNYSQKGQGFRIVLDLDEQDYPRLLGQWPTIIAQNDSAYHLPPSQAKAWNLSNNKLIQTQPLVVRDACGTINRGLFGIDQVASVDDRRVEIGNVLAATSPLDHQEFINCVMQHRRAVELPLFVYRTTVLDLTDFERISSLHVNHEL